MQKSNFLLTLTLLAMSIWTNAVFAEPAITGASATGTTIKFTVQLSEKLFSGYKVKIDLQNGKGLVAMKCSALTCTLSSNALPKGVDDTSYNVGIYDAKGVLQGETIDAPYVITATAEVNAIPTAPPVNTVPTASTGYTKISNSGATLPATAELGTGTTDWACTKDNKTGLIWEVKNRDRGLRDWNKTYTWDESVAFATSVNSQTLCGNNDWRVPSDFELSGIVKSGETNPSINTTYFPNTQSYFFWSSSIGGFRVVGLVRFDNGDSGWYSQNSLNYVRLVR